MVEEYDALTVEHYAAYRPKLHGLILEKCIPEGETFSLGLDIGCGTGHSSIALSKFCKSVMGIDPNVSMIDKAFEHPQIKYQISNVETLDFVSNTFDLITFAGSLHYAKSKKLFDEVIRVLKKNGIVVVYDFEILLADVLHELAFEPPENIGYDHEAGFSDLLQDSIYLFQKNRERISIEITSSNLAHLILAVKAQYLFFRSRFGADDLHKKLMARLQPLSNSKKFKIDANIFYQVYGFSK